MDKFENEKRRREWIVLFLYFVFFAGLFCSWRAVSSSSIGLLFIAGLLFQNSSSKKLAFSRIHTLFIIGAAVYLVIVLLYLWLNGLFFFSSADLQLKLGLLIAPISIISSWPVIKRKEIVFTIYCGLLFLASAFCLTMAISRALAHHDPSILFYHQLVSPFNQHAVYFSIYCFLGVFFLHQKWVNFPFNNKKTNIALSIFFSIFILLLSSKLVIGFLLVLWLQFILARIISSAKRILAVIILAVLTSVILFTNNPIGARFRDSFSGDPLLAEKEKFDPGVYFNGAQFRLLQWKLVPHVLSVKNAWIWGVGPLNAQSYLDEEYLARNMYSGKDKNDRGYLAYNCHNQLLESLLRYGIPGMLCFLFLLFLLALVAIRMRGFAGTLVISLIMVYSLLESVLETQYGILLFCGLPFLVELMVTANLRENSNDYKENDH